MGLQSEWAGNGSELMANKTCTSAFHPHSPTGRICKEDLSDGGGRLAAGAQDVTWKCIGCVRVSFAMKFQPVFRANPFGISPKTL